MKDLSNEIYELEEGNNLKLDFTKLLKAISKTFELIPVAVQNTETLEVILIVYINKYAFEKSISTPIATFWSTSRNELWIKGASSGNTLNYSKLELTVNRTH